MEITSTRRPPRRGPFVNTYGISEQNFQSSTFSPYICYKVSDVKIKYVPEKLDASFQKAERES